MVYMPPEARSSLRHCGFSGHSKYVRVAAVSVLLVSGSAMNGSRNMVP